MRKTLALTSVALAAAMIGPAATADEVPGLYLGVGGGADWLQDMDLNGGPSGDIDSDIGFAAIGSLGYRFGNGIRTELEGGYRNNDGDTAGNNVETQAWNAMANVLYGFDLGIPVRPYLGAGVGAVNADVDIDGVGSDDNWAFGYQGIAGAEYAVTDTVAIYADYRYLATEGLDVDPGAASIDDEYRSHTAMAGVRWTFWTPTPPAPEPEPVAAPAPEPAPPAEAPPESYIVFFDFDKSELTPEALDIIRQAAENVKQGGASRVQVVGHADTSGTDDYNVALSQRRAEAVAAELAAQGVPQDQIGIDWKGESEPLVPTGDGVKEPQNRRATIEVQQASS